MSMSVSVESRVPLLDHRIVEFMATVPPHQKVPGMQPKGLLRDAARGSIPEMIRKRQDKRPFPVPFEFWVHGVLDDLSREVLLSPQSLDRGILDRRSPAPLGSHERGDLVGAQHRAVVPAVHRSRRGVDRAGEGAPVLQGVGLRAGQIVTAVFQRGHSLRVSTPVMFCLVASAAAAQVAPAGGQGQYDIVIANGTIIDGTGGPRYRGDVAIVGDRVVRVERGSIPAGSAKRTIDARGLIVAPGFIDLHAHLDPLPQMPDAQSAVTQGVTLALGGPDGGGPWPFGPYLDSIAAQAARHQRRLSRGTQHDSPSGDGHGESRADGR